MRHWNGNDAVPRRLKGTVTEVVKTGASYDIYVKTDSTYRHLETLILSPRMFGGISWAVGTQVELEYRTGPSYGLWFAVKEIKS